MRSPASTTPSRATQAGSARWVKTLHRWHWISSALCLAGMLLFAITGITLNHASDIEAKPTVHRWEDQIPEPLLATLKAEATRVVDAHAEDRTPVPAALSAWLRQQHGLKIPDNVLPEWSEDEIYAAMPRPGGDAWVRVAMEDGHVEFEDSDRGWLAYANDLHKGRNTGLLWRVFLDVFAVGALVFCITGLLILQRHAAQRSLTWPLTAAGLVIPVLLALLFIH
jgi:uncharacterized protein